MIWVGKGNCGFIDVCFVMLDYRKDARVFDLSAVLRRQKIKDFRLVIRYFRKRSVICGRKKINSRGAVINRNLIGFKNL